MSWWKNIFGGQPSAQSKSRFPVTLNVLPGKLAVRVYLHSIDCSLGQLRCWSYVTEGLAAHGQKEIVFTLRRRDSEGDEEFPRQVPDFFGQFISWPSGDSSWMPTASPTSIPPTSFWA